MRKKIFLSAIEHSADLHQSVLARQLLRLDPTLELIGVGSFRSREAGVNVVMDLTPTSTIGFLEPLRYLPRLVRAIYKLRKLIQELNPDALVLIDGQGFHMPLLKRLGKVMFPRIYYISPHEWQWGTVRGGRNVIRHTEKILAIFKEEAEFYRGLGGAGQLRGASHFGRDVAGARKRGLLFGIGLGSRTAHFRHFPGVADSRVQNHRAGAFACSQTGPKRVP